MQMSFADLDFPLSVPNFFNSMSCCRLLSAELQDMQHLVPLLTDILLPGRRMWTSLHTQAGQMASAIHSCPPASLWQREGGRNE